MRVRHWIAWLNARTPLSVKVVLPVFVAGVVSIGVALALGLQTERQSVRRLYLDRGRVAAELVTSGIALDGGLANLERVQQHIEAAASGGSLLAVRLYTLDAGRPAVLASSDPTLLGQPASEFEVSSITSHAYSATDSTLGGKPAVEVLGPLIVGGGPEASIGVYMSTDLRDEALSSLTRRVLAIGATGLAASVLLVYISAEFALLRRVHSMSQAIKLVEAGEYATRLNAPERAGARDEPALLADGFDRMVEAVQKLHEKTAELATTDDLTGLYNRRYFKGALESEIRRAKRLGYSVTLLFIDADRFKLVNDLYGHAGGDRVLLQLGAVLRRSLRDMDVLARYGGEEFAVILPGCQLSDSAEAAERLRKSVESNTFVVNPSGETTRLTITVGAATYPDTANEAADLVAKSDQAMYWAKDAGRNRVAVAGSQPSSPPERT